LELPETKLCDLKADPYQAKNTTSSIYGAASPELKWELAKQLAEQAGCKAGLRVTIVLKFSVRFLFTVY